MKEVKKDCVKKENDFCRKTYLILIVSDILNAPRTYRRVDCFLFYSYLLRVVTEFLILKVYAPYVLQVSNEHRNE